MARFGTLENVKAALGPPAEPPALQRTAREHAIDYRISFTLLGHQLYVVMLAGEDRRSVQRLHDEGQLRPFLLLAIKACLLLTVLLGALVMLMGASMITLYALKTLAGIDFFEGTSFLHALFA